MRSQVGDVWQTPATPSKDGTYSKNSGRITAAGRDIKPERTVGGRHLSFVEVANRFRQATTTRAKSPIRRARLRWSVMPPVRWSPRTSRTLRKNTTARNSNQPLVKTNHTARGFRTDCYKNHLTITSKRASYLFFRVANQATKLSFTDV